MAAVATKSEPSGSGSARRRKVRVVKRTPATPVARTFETRLYDAIWSAVSPPLRVSHASLTNAEWGLIQIAGGAKKAPPPDSEGKGSEDVSSPHLAAAAKKASGRKAFFGGPKAPKVIRKAFRMRGRRRFLRAGKLPPPPSTRAALRKKIEMPWFRRR